MVVKNTKLNCCEKDLEKLKDFSKLLSDKNRLRIICALRKEEMCVCEICEQLDLTQNLASHHLKLLEKANIVSWKKVGVKVFYKLNTKELEKNTKLLAKFFLKNNVIS